MSKDASSSRAKPTYDRDLSKSLDEIKPGDIIVTRNGNLALTRRFFGLGNRDSTGHYKKDKHWNTAPHPELVLEVNKERGTVTTVQISSFQKSKKLAQVNPPIPNDKWKYLIPVPPSRKESDEQPFTVEFKHTNEELEDGRGHWVNVHTTFEIAPKSGTDKVRTIIRILLTVVTY